MFSELIRNKSVEFMNNRIIAGGCLFNQAFHLISFYNKNIREVIPGNVRLNDDSRCFAMEFLLAPLEHLNILLVIINSFAALLGNICRARAGI